MKEIIKIDNLNYFYTTYKREQGFFGAIKDFSKRNIEKVHSIKEFNLSVKEGEIIGIMGPN
ncbi:MAG: hypothetical protein ACTHWZ_07750 [Peptoniphilaceae bacterium]